MTQADCFDAIPTMPLRFQYQGDPRFPIHPLFGCLPLFAVMLLMCLLPLVLYDVGRSALERLGFSPVGAALAVLGIFMGSLINIPVYEIRKDELQPEVQFGPLGMMLPRSYRRVQMRTLIAVNLGGCLIPAGLAVLQALRLAYAGPGSLLAAGIVSLVSILVCWWSPARGRDRDSDAGIHPANRQRTDGLDRVSRRPG